MVDRQLLERIDACRPGSNDLDDPRLSLAEELAGSPPKRDLYERVQSLDRAISEAIDDVPLPEGLSERLLARLAIEGLVSAAENLAPEGVPPAAAPAPRASSVPRRLWRSASIGLAAAASIAAIIAGVNLWQRPALTVETVKAQVLQYNDEPLAGAPLEAGLPQGYPLSRYIYRLPRTTWRPVYGFLHRNDLNGVAYDMMFRGTTATLFVISAPAKQLPTAPPLRTGMASGNRAVAAWQENGLLYVLVVDGNDRAYQSFIRRPAQA
jgi:hypothetical protein